MSEDALAKHIDERLALGSSTPQPTDPETRDLVGTVRLAEAALGTPKPSEEAERESRERVVSQLRETARDQKAASPGILDKFKGLFRGKK